MLTDVKHEVDLFRDEYDKYVNDDKVSCKLAVIDNIMQLNIHVIYRQ